MSFLKVLTGRCKTLFCCSGCSLQIVDHYSALFKKCIKREKCLGSFWLLCIFCNIEVKTMWDFFGVCIKILTSLLWTYGGQRPGWIKRSTGWWFTVWLIETTGHLLLSLMSVSSLKDLSACCLYPHIYITFPLLPTLYINKHPHTHSCCNTQIISLHVHTQTHWWYF